MSDCTDVENNQLSTIAQHCQQVCTRLKVQLVWVPSLS